MITRNEALDLVKKHVKNGNLVKHMIAVAAIMRRMAEHFEEEEAPDGFPQIIETAPHHARTLEHLFEEHKTILVTLQNITTNALTCLHGPMAAVRRDVATLCETLRTHESTETDLLTDSVYQDIGSGD